MTETQKQSLQVFLCHSVADKPAVRSLYQRLIADKVDAWLDEENLIPGQNWQDEIPKAVRASDVVIVCLSRNSVSKEGYIQKEIKLALDIANEKPEGTIFIIPLRLEECVVPERLKIYQWVDLFNHNAYEKLILSLGIRATQLGINQPAKNNVPQSITPVLHRDIQHRTVEEANETILYDGSKGISGYDILVTEGNCLFQNGALVFQGNVGIFGVCKYFQEDTEKLVLTINQLKTNHLHVRFQARTTHTGWGAMVEFINYPKGVALAWRRIDINHTDWKQLDLYFRIDEKRINGKECYLFFVMNPLSALSKGQLEIKDLVVLERNSL